MANYSILKAAIARVIKYNGNNEITGDLLQQQLFSMVNTLGTGYQCMGVAVLTPTPTNPGTPDANVFYIASEPGTYTNFGGIVINDGEVCLLTYNGTWSKRVTGAATAADVAVVVNLVSTILGLIPSAATSSNKLATEDEISKLGQEKNTYELVGAGSTHVSKDIPLISGHAYLLSFNDPNWGRDATQTASSQYLLHVYATGDPIVDFVSVKGIDGVVDKHYRFTIPAGYSTVKVGLRANSGVNVLYSIVDETALGDYVPKSDIQDSLNSEAPDKPLSAKQGKVLDEKLKNEVPKVDEATDQADLDIADEQYHILARFSGGHFRTKKFDSSKSPLISEFAGADLSFGDENGNILVAFQNGHIYTKNFNSENIEERIAHIEDLLPPYDLLSVDGVDYALASQKKSDKTFSASNNYSQFFNIAHVTDLHGDEKRFALAAKYTRLLGLDCLCNTGDSVQYNSSDDSSYIFKHINKEKYVECVGNHDVWTLYDTSDIYEKYFEQMEGHLTFDDQIPYPTYGYKDFPGKKIRMIFVNQWEPDGGDTRHYYFYYTQRQLQFVISALSATPQDYGVILMAHSPEKDSVIRDETYNKFFMSGHEPDLARFCNYTPLKDIIDAFISRQTLSATYTYKNNLSYSISADFSNINSGVEFIMLLNGHTHVDLIGYVGNATNMIVQANEMCSNAWINVNQDGTPGTSYPYYNEANDLARQNDTPSENAFNIYSIDRERGVVKVIRIGSQVSCIDFTRRDFMEIPYRINN